MGLVIFECKTAANIALVLIALRQFDRLVRQPAYSHPDPHTKSAANDFGI
jgi:hypothetical protein